MEIPSPGLLNAERRSNWVRLRTLNVLRWIAIVGQLSAILEYAAQLQEVDTANIPPTATVLPLTAPLREDTIRPSLPQDEILANASSSEEGMFQVAPVLEQEP